MSVNGPVSVHRKSSARDVVPERHRRVHVDAHEREIRFLVPFHDVLVQQLDLVVLHFTIDRGAGENGRPPTELKRTRA